MGGSGGGLQVFFDWLSGIRCIWEGFKRQLGGNARRRDPSLTQMLDLISGLRGKDRLATQVAFSSCVAVSGLWSWVWMT